MKKTMVALTAAVSIFALSACNNASDSTVLVETSAGEITKEDLYNELKEQAGSQVLQEMVYDKILSDKYEVTDKEIDAKVEEYQAALGQQFDAVVAQRGEEAVRDILRSEILREKSAKAHLEIKDGEVIKASHILIKTEMDATEEEVAAAEKKAKDIKAQIDGGASFEELAKEHSQDGSAANGGDLGWFGKGAMVAEFEEAAFALNKDQISDVVKSQFGFHIIKLTDKVEKFAELEEEKKNEISTALIRQNPTAVTDALAKEVEAAKVDVKEEDFKELFKTAEATE